MPLHSDYTVACICPMGVELAPVKALLDETHPSLATQHKQNSYVLGNIGGHNIVIAVLPEIGNNAATAVATQLLNDFPSIRFGLLVGIGGGIPDLQHHVDIRLGDVVVSKPTKTAGGVVQYDMGKENIKGFERTGTLDKPPAILRAAIQRLVADQELVDSQVPAYLSQMLEKYPKMKEKYSRPKDEDQLFETSYDHQEGDTCARCDAAQTISRSKRESANPVIYYGTIGSANRVVKNAAERDKLKASNLGIMCVEMEAAGLMESFPCLVIRGICDYADSHKNKIWQPYAAATAAAYMKELLSVISTPDVSMSLPASDVVKVSQNPQRLYPVHWTVTRSVNPLFTGRAELLSELESIVREAVESRGRSNPCWIVISGMGGQGKSEICVQIAHSIRQLFWGIFWIDVSTASLAENGFLQIASQLQVSVQTWEDARQLLSNLKEPWLLVLDNADDVDVDYQQYFPSGPLGVVFLTSRNAECQRYATTKWIDLQGLSDNEARELLLRAIHIPHAEHQMLDYDAQVVACLLNSHPLAIIQAGSYVSRGHCSLKDYPNVYQRHRKRLLTFRPSQAQSRYRDVYATFEASAEILRSSNSESASDALQLLSVLASLGPTRLPLPLFEAGWKGAQMILPGDGDNDDLSQVMPWHVSQLLPLISADSHEWDSFRLIEAIHQLKAFSLVSMDAYDSGGMSISLHLLIHAWASDRLNPKEQHESWVMAGSLIAISRTDSLLWQKHQWQLQPHVHALVSREMIRIFGSEPPTMVVRILMNCGWQLHEMCDDTQLLALMSSLFTHLGMDRMTLEPHWLDVYDLTGRNLHDCGQVKDAVLLLEQVVKTREQTQAENHSSRLRTHPVLARAYRANGQVKEAVSLLQHVVKICEQTQAEDHPDRLKSQHELAEAYRANGQIKEAVSLVEQVVKIREQTQAEDHPDRLASQQVLARIYRANGQVKVAVSLLQHVLKIREQTQAEDHPGRLASQHDLAKAYQANGQVKEALSLLQQVVKISEQTLAEDHPDRLASQQVLAGAYRADGQVKEALPLLQHVVKIREQTQTDDHPDRLASQHGLASAYLANGQVTEAVSLLQQVVEIREHTLAEDHPDRLASQHELASAYLANGQVKEALSLLQHVVKIREQTQAEDHPGRLWSQHELASAYLANGQVTGAVSLLQQVVKIREHTLAEDHPHRLASQHELARAYLVNGQVTEAVSLLQQVVEIREHTLADDHPDRLASQHQLSVSFWEFGNRQMSIQIMRQVVEIQQRTLDEHHPAREASEGWLKYFLRLR